MAARLAIHFQYLYSLKSNLILFFHCIGNRKYRRHLQVTTSFPTTLSACSSNSSIFQTQKSADEYRTNNIRFLDITESQLTEDQFFKYGRQQLV